MMPTFNIEFVALGAVGGLIPDAIRFAKGRQKGFPAWFRKVGYWVGLAVLVGLGALAAWLGNATTVLAALAMGFSAPEVISRLVGAQHKTVRGEIGGFPVQKWWTA